MRPRPADADPARPAGRARLHPAGRRSRCSPTSSTCPGRRPRRRDVLPATSATRPPAGVPVRICRAEACQSVGCERARRPRATSGSASTSARRPADGAVTLDQVFCLGNCALGPSVEVDGRLLRPGRRRPARRPAGGGAATSMTEPRHGLRPARLRRPLGRRRRGRRPDRAAAAARRRESALVRNGSRGLLWLEPLVEVATADGRIAYGPVQPARRRRPARPGLLDGGDHPLCGSAAPTRSSGCADQHRVTFARVGVIDPLLRRRLPVAHGGLRRPAPRPGA